MRIAFVSMSVGRGGAEIQVVDLAIELARRGHRVLLLTLTTIDTLADALAAAGVEYVSLGMKAKSEAPLALARYARTMVRFAPDIIHAHMFACIMMARLGRFATPRARIFETTHTSAEKRELRYRFYRMTNRLGGNWSSVSAAGLATHLAKGAVRAGTVARNGVRTDEMRRQPDLRLRMRDELGMEGKFMWLAIGSFRDEEKDFGNMFGAYRQVAAARHDAFLVIAGQGVLFEEKRRLAASLGLSSRVRFLGPRNDISALLSAADAFVLSSRSEALPLVLLEASSACLPIVATAVGDVRDVVLDERMGRVVPPRDPDALAAAMLAIMSLSESERQAMGEAARAHCVDTFDLRAVSSRWEQEYQAALAPAP